jgi:hypothetical protein
MTLLQPGALSDDDPQKLSILQALPQISSLMAEKFVPYLPNLLEKLLKDAAADIDIKMEDAEISQMKGASKEEGVTSITLSMKGLEGHKQLSLNTTALEAKITACDVIKELIKLLGDHFYPFVP